jgi:hypothetical protein
MSAIGCSSVPFDQVTEIGPSDVRVGDVLFFHSASSAEGVIRGYTYGDYTHCGVVVNFDDGFSDARNFEEVRLSVADEVERTGCRPFEVPVVVHVDRGMEIARPQQLCLTPKFREEPDRHIDLRRPHHAVDADLLTKAALEQVGLVYDYPGLVTGGLQAVEGYGKFDEVAKVMLLVNAVIRAFRSSQEDANTNGMSSGASDASVLESVGHIFDLVKSVVPGSKKRACSDFVLHCFLNGNAEVLGRFPKTIALHPSLRVDFNVGIGDMERNMDAGGNHHVNVDPKNCERDNQGRCPSGVHQSRIGDLAAIRRMNLALNLAEASVDVGEFLAAYEHCAPSNIYDATGFVDTTFRLDFERD